MTKQYNYKAMEKLFVEKDFSKYGFKKYKTSNNRFFWFKDNKAKILAVAHLDSVVENKFHFNKVSVKNDQTYVLSPVLDDRLGVYVIVEHLIKLGLEYDILLTTDEEIGCSTAMYFDTTKKYNWGFSFDRTGTDVVNYDYSDRFFNKKITEVGFKIGFGSFSDISYLEHLNCKFLNVGVAYYNYHSLFAYANMDELEQQIDKFVHFYKRNKNTIFSHKKKTYKDKYVFNKDEYLFDKNSVFYDDYKLIYDQQNKWHRGSSDYYDDIKYDKRSKNIDWYDDTKPLT